MSHQGWLSCNSFSLCGWSQFIDLCILLGCDYCGTIKGIGPKRAIDLIRQHGCIEEILENIDSNVNGCFLNPETHYTSWFGSEFQCFSCLPSCRSTLLQRTGCTRRPGACFWLPRWWIVPQWSWSGMNRMMRDWSSSCALRNNSGKISAASLLMLMVIQYLTTRLCCWPCRGRVYDTGVTRAHNLFGLDCWAW